MAISLVGLASMMEPLRGFVAVGRRLSITAAARELYLSQSALSRQVQALEQRLQVKLFVRRNRAITFTPEGERLFRSATAAFQQLEDAIGVLRTTGPYPPVTLSASVGVTGLWLLPRIGRFQSKHPDVELRLAADNRLADLKGEGIDLAIRYSRRPPAGVIATKLFRETVTPVAHPGLGIAGLRCPKDIAAHVLLELDEPGRPWLHWQDWLASIGCQNARPRSMLRFNRYDQIVRSAMAGQGIALGRLELIRPMLADNSLVVLKTLRPGPKSDHAYWLLQADAQGGPNVAAVVDWIEAEAADLA